MIQNVHFSRSLLEARDVAVEQEELGFLKAIELGLIEAKENRTVSLSDVRKHLALKLKRAS